MKWMVEASGVRRHSRDTSLEATAQKIYWIEKATHMANWCLRFLWLWHYYLIQRNELKSTYKMLLSGCHIIIIFLHLLVLLSTKKKDFSLSLSLCHIIIINIDSFRTVRAVALVFVAVAAALEFGIRNRIVIGRALVSSKPWCSLIFQTSTHHMQHTILAFRKFGIKNPSPWSNVRNREVNRILYSNEFWRVSVMKTNRTKI